MEIRQFEPDDREGVQQCVTITNAIGELDSPWMHPATAKDVEGELRWGWDLEPPAGFLATDGGEAVGYAEYWTSEWDNHHLAWLWIGVHPAHRGRRHGTALFEAVHTRARAEGRRSVGIDGWESEATLAFAKRHGFEKKSQSIIRRQTLAELDWGAVERLRAEARLHASSYELLRIRGRIPDDLLPALADLAGAINDAPTDDLDIEDEVFPPERVRNYETAQLARGRLLYRVVARHRETGELAGHTVVVVESERPWIGDQHDTAVARAHRGHRLGLLVKSDMMLWLREAEPQLATIDTYNAESNDQMIRVNERLGYRILGRQVEFQRDV